MQLQTSQIIKRNSETEIWFFGKKALKLIKHLARLIKKKNR